MKDVLNKSTWDRPYAMQSWGSLVAVLFCSIVFFASYGGTSWWVQYYNRPDGQIATDSLSFGLFRMCIRGDCVIDMTNRHLIKYFLPDGIFHSFITWIYIAPLQGYYSEVLNIIITPGNVTH